MPAPAQSSLDVHHTFHRSLIFAHARLRDAAEGLATAIVDSAQDRATDGRILELVEELENHHKSEAAFFFPAFRKAGRLKSSDVAFLDARDTEHIAIVELCGALRDAAVRHARGGLATSAWRPLVAATAAELLSAARPHFEVEERVLTGEHLVTLISARELQAVYRDMGRNWNRR
jgi:hypothetical protein